MVTRREILGSSVAILAASGSGGIPTQARVRDSKRNGVCDHVDPFIGTGGHGHVYPGASVPFGMVQLSPDTNNKGWDACSGYHHGDDTVAGFSHTHLSGTGIGDMMDVLVMPNVGPIALDSGSPSQPQRGYRQRFDPADERASPGYYRTFLKGSGVEVELTATERVGFHRYAFPHDAVHPHILIDLNYAMEDAAVTEASIRRIGPDMLVGTRRVHSWADGRVIHFALQVSQPFSTATFFSNDRPVASKDGAAGANLKCVLSYTERLNAPLLIKVGLSSVDVDGALGNLKGEVADWNFDGVRAAASKAWERELSRITIEGADEQDLRIFYTAYYHTMMAPTIFSDLDGRYRGMDTAIHKLPDGAKNYSTYSLWDTYRAVHPFFSLVQPRRNQDLIAGLVRMAQESPHGPPVWPLQGIETGCMIGCHSAVVIAEACAKQVSGIDYVAAWNAYRDYAFQTARLGLADYRGLGFVPSDREGEGASKTLEYAYDDWAMATIAEAAGDRESANLLRARSRNYANVFDREVAFVRPRLADGRWAEPFDPRDIGHDKVKWRDFTESNAWQATFLNQHDLYQYMELFGGERAFEAKLDQLFTVSGLLPDAPQDISGLVGQYAHGNEPSHHVAYLYAYAGAHYKTQARVRMLLETQYRDAADGVAGNEDCGQMSAWYLMSAMGLYPVDPVSATYIFGSPIFPRVSLELAEGKRLLIEARGVSAQNFYIQSVEWNGKPWKFSWISHEDLEKGGRLIFQMGSRPNLEFGSGKSDRPPSFRSPVEMAEAKAAPHSS